MRFLLWVVVNALAVGVATALLDGIELTGSSTGEQAVTLLVVGLVFGVIDSVVAPVVKLLSLPFILLTLGLLLFVINALMLMLTGWVADQLGLGFSVDGFWTALLGAIVITVASWILEAVFPDKD
jgi:putative membrane protein